MDINPVEMFGTHSLQPLCQYWELGSKTENSVDSVEVCILVIIPVRCYVHHTGLQLWMTHWDVLSNLPTIQAVSRKLWFHFGEQMWGLNSNLDSYICLSVSLHSRFH